VGQLAGGIAHDFNNLLTAIIGHIELLRPVLAPGTQARADLEEIRAAAERAADLTRQLLAFGRKQILQPVLLDLNAEVASLLRMLERLVGENFELRFAPRPGLGPVRVDRGQLGQVIVNLVVNARDAMMPGGGKILMESDEVMLDPPLQAQLAGTAPGRYVVLAITDTGSGMSPETQARIFEPFFSTKAMGAGTGLGLATVYGVVKQSGGTVSVESEPGRGSTFRVYFPMAPADAEPAPASGAPQQVPIVSTTPVPAR
jgi:signal transduction histidine kinase